MKRFWRAVLIVAGLVVLGAGCASDRSAGLTRQEFERAEMGLPFRLVLYAPDAESARRAAEAEPRRRGDAPIARFDDGRHVGQERRALRG